jgi:DNA modification methylase
LADLAVSYRPIAELIPYARNARTHSDEQVAEIAASIREFGWTNPILVDGANGIVAGHGRVLAAKALGIDPVPCIELAGLSEAQRRAYIIADNKLALNAGWDDALLRVELADLRDMAFDLSLIGFGEAEQAAILDKTEGLTDPDDTLAPPEHPISEPGDLWLLGRYRLLSGDSTVATDVERVLGGVEPHLMVTDPPYGVEYDANWRNERVREDGSPSDGRAIGKVVNDDNADWREAWALFPGDVAYVWHADLRARAVVESLEAAGFEMRAQIIWAKGRFAIGRGHYHFQHEPCWYAVRKNGTAHWAGDRAQTTLWEISHSKSETGHSTQKPAACMRRPIENNSSPGQAVYEPFSGSGTTIIAAEMTGRCCHAIEISPAYVDVAVKRWQNFTGAPATLDGDGRSFDEVASARAQAEAGEARSKHAEIAGAAARARG